AHRAVRRSWADLARTRLSDLLWPFAVWSILIAPFWFVHLRAGGLDASRMVLGGLAFGGTRLWFLTALAVFLIIGKLTWRAPVPVLIVAATLAYGLRGPFLAWLAPLLPEPLVENIGR